MGLNIPEDLVILGFDDFEWASLADPPLTAISQPFYNLGENAAELLIKKINKVSNKENDRKPMVISYNAELVIRDSTPKIKS